MCLSHNSSSTCVLGSMKRPELLPDAHQSHWSHCIHRLWRLFTTKRSSTASTHSGRVQGKVEMPSFVNFSSLFQGELLTIKLTFSAKQPKSPFTKLQSAAHISSCCTTRADRPSENSRILAIASMISPARLHKLFTL